MVSLTSASSRATNSGFLLVKGQMRFCLCYKVNLPWLVAHFDLAKDTGVGERILGRMWRIFVAESKKGEEEIQESWKVLIDPTL